MKRINFKRMALAMLMVCLGTIQGWADDVECFSRGVAHCILNDGSGNFPVAEAGEVAVGLTAEESLTWNAGTATSVTAINVGNATSGKVKQTFFFHARAKEGYRFIGWTTTKTGKTPTSGSPTDEDTPYTKTYTHWAAGTAEAPKESVVYAIFETTGDADGEPTDLGDGVAFERVENNVINSGASTKSTKVRVFFAESLLYNGLTTATAGVNADAVKYATCKDSEGKRVTIGEISVFAPYADQTYTTFGEAYGTLELPAGIPIGEYDVHLPYGLFKTAQGGVTAACDFKVTVRADETPFELVATSPVEGGEWNADPTSDKGDGKTVMVTLTFNKVITGIDDTKKISLTNAYGMSFEPESVSKSLINSAQGIVQYGILTNGNYTFTLPEGVFTTANGTTNEAFTLHFSVTGSTDLPQYTTIALNPASGSEVRSVTRIAIDMSREGYDEPLALMPDAAAVTAEMFKTIYKEGVDYTDPDSRPEIVQTAIQGILTSVLNGQLVVTFTEPVAQECQVVVNIPAGITNNLAMPVATMTTEELLAEGGCTNPAIQLTYNVRPYAITVTDVTGIGTVDHWVTDENGNYVKDENGNYMRVDRYKSLVNAQLTPAAADGEGDRVTYMYFWYDEPFATLNYSGGASVTNITTGKEYGIAAVEFKTGGDHYRNNVIQLRLSTEAFIQSDVYDQGVYEVVLPSGIARTADGMLNEGTTFRFTYGDPEKAYRPEAIDLDEYLGDYRMMVEEGEMVERIETFSFAKDSENATYYVTDLCGCSTMMIPVKAQDGGFVLLFTEEGDDAFMGTTGGDVTISFVKQDGEVYIFIDQYALYTAADAIIGGCTWYGRVDLEGISAVAGNESTRVPVFNLAGQRIANGQTVIGGRGIAISRGKKMVY